MRAEVTARERLHPLLRAVIKLSNRALLTQALGLALTASVGCSDHNIALVGRDTLPSGAIQPVQSDIVGTVKWVDTAYNEAHIRRIAGNSGLISDSAEPRLVYRDREYSVSRKEFGHVVAMQ